MDSGYSDPKRRKPSELDAPARPEVLTREEREFAEAQLAKGMSIAAVAKALGRPEATVRKPVTLDDEFQAPPAGQRRENMSERWERERSERAERNRAKWERPPIEPLPDKKDRRLKLDRNTWHAPKKGD